MKVLITGSRGFVGKNLIQSLSDRESITVIEFHRGNTHQELKDGIRKADVLIHLAGVNRPDNQEEFDQVNFGLTEEIVSILENENKDIPIIFSSSTQVLEDNAYGKSKLKAEHLLLSRQDKQASNIYVLRLPGLFGQGCKPNYNSVVATFCNNIQRNIPIEIHHPNKILELIYIQDLIQYINNLLEELPKSKNPITPNLIHSISLESLARTLEEFKHTGGQTKRMGVSKSLTNALYATFQSYTV